MASPIDPANFKHQPQRSSAEIAKSILGFYLYHPDASGSTAPDNKSGKFGFWLEEAGKEDTQIDFQGYDHPINIMERNAADYEELFNALTRLASSNPLSNEALEILRKAPQLVEVMVQREEAHAKEDKDLINPNTTEDIKREEMGRLLLRMFNRDPDDPNVMEERRSINVENHYNALRIAKNMREGVLPLFSELALALEREKGGPAAGR